MCPRRSNDGSRRRRRRSRRPPDDGASRQVSSRPPSSPRSPSLAWIVLSPVSEREHEPPPATMANWQDVETGWTRLADLPTPLQGSVRVWADGSLIVWGGNEGDGAGQSSQGWRLDRVDGSWRTIASSPLSPRSWAAAAWTGSELLIWGGASGPDPMSDPLADGAAYDPATDTWRSLAPAPLTARSPLTSVWTGSRWLIWGEGPSRTSASAMDGAAYDPATDTWTSIPTAPLRINDGHAVWTGTEMVVFGAELLGGNHAQTEFAVGEAFDPASGTWRELPPSHLDPQATDITWDGQQVIAADYLAKVQTYDPIADAWGDLPDPPLDTGEDSPQLAVADGRAIEHLFGGTPRSCPPISADGRTSPPRATTAGSRCCPPTGSRSPSLPPIVGECRSSYPLRTKPRRWARGRSYRSPSRSAMAAASRSGPEIASSRAGAQRPGARCPRRTGSSTTRRRACGRRPRRHRSLGASPSRSGRAPRRSSGAATTGRGTTATAWPTTRRTTRGARSPRHRWTPTIRP